jgi:hypothetical protein
MKIRSYGSALAAAVAFCVVVQSGGAAPPPGSSATPRAPHVRSVLRSSAPTVAPSAKSTSSRLLRDERPATPTRVGSAQRTQIYNQNRRIDINNINMFVTNYGTFANDIENQGNSGLFFPKGTIKTAVYQSGIWLVGKVGSEIRAAIGEYSQEYAPGAMIGTAPDDPGKAEYIVYKVQRYTGSPSDTDHVERDPAAVAKDRTLDPLVHHSWSEYLNGAAIHGAPTRMYRFADPNSPGDSVDVLGPDIRGDQMLWCVYNDADPGVHINRAGQTLPLGIEVQQSTFAFDRQGALGNTVFLEFKVINKGTQNIDSCYVNLWSDPDLGGAGDDLVGCDTTLSLGYIYNATNNDQLYADRPPAVGYDFFKGPVANGDTLGLTSFIFYINGTDPANEVQTYNYMRGFQRDGSPFLDNLGNPTKFYASGDPVTGTGYLDTNPSDRRFMNISGPFTLAVGDTQTIVGAIVIAQGADRLTSITGLKFFDKKAQTAFDIDFQLPPPPPQPKVTYSTSRDAINLSWDSGSRFNYTPYPGWDFEGYVVYQGASISGPWKRLKVFDIPNGITDVRDTVFDVNTGLIINDTPTAFGGDNGVQYTFSTTQDAIRGGPLREGMTYYYAVTAYAVNPNPPAGFEKVLETSFNPVAITVQRPASGTDVGAARVDASHVVNPDATPTTDHVVVDVVDPSAITGHTYMITYKIVGPDTVWSLVDRTTGQTLIANQTEKTDVPSYAPVDGMVVKLRESQALDTSLPLNDVYYAPFDNDMPFHGVGAGLTTFEDSFGYAFDFFAGIDPTTQPNLFKSVELRFGSTQKAYRYFRDEKADGSAPPTLGRGYTYQGFHDVPFQAWNVDDNVQLEVGFVERRITDDNNVASGPQPSTQDGTWMPDGSSLGGREYLFISARPYTGSPIPELAQDGAVVGNDTLWMYAAWLYRTGTVKPGDKFIIQEGGNVPGGPTDTLVFETHAPATNIVSLQKSKLNNIRAVPNPYYSRSAYELSSFNRIIKFMNMPERATVRIYDLSGHLIRTLQKTDQSSSIMEWDVNNENQLPVASGIYVYTVEVPNAGTTTGRLVVFMEKERLQNF